MVGFEDFAAYTEYDSGMTQAASLFENLQTGGTEGVIAFQREVGDAFGVDY